MYKFILNFKILRKNREQIIDWFCESKSVAWVASCKGKWDLNVTIYAKNILS